MTGFGHGDFVVILTAHHNTFRTSGRGFRPTIDAIAGAAIAEVFNIDVVNIGKSMCDAPRDIFSMTKVRERRHAGHSKADGVEIGTGQMQLRVDAGYLVGAVRIARHQWLTACSMRAANGPIV